MEVDAAFLARLLSRGAAMSRRPRPSPPLRCPPLPSPRLPSSPLPPLPLPSPSRRARTPPRPQPARQHRRCQAGTRRLLTRCWRPAARYRRHRGRQAGSRRPLTQWRAPRRTLSRARPPRLADAGTLEKAAMLAARNSRAAAWAARHGDRAAAAARRIVNHLAAIGSPPIHASTTRSPVSLAHSAWLQRRRGTSVPLRPCASSAPPRWIPRATRLITVRASGKNSALDHQKPLPLLRSDAPSRIASATASPRLAATLRRASTCPQRCLQARCWRADSWSRRWQMGFVDPGATAVGFEIDACLPASGGAVTCAAGLRRSMPKPMQVRIGPYAFDTPVVLAAPMAGVFPIADLFRVLRAGASARRWRPRKCSPADPQAWLRRKSRQLPGAEGKASRASCSSPAPTPKCLPPRRAGVALGAQIIDRRMGCPAKVPAGRADRRCCFGRALVARILGAVVRAVAVPVTLKICWLGPRTPPTA